MYNWIKRVNTKTQTSFCLSASEIITAILMKNIFLEAKMTVLGSLYRLDIF